MPARTALTALALCLLPLQAAAQETVASYYAALGPQDYRNSRGTALTDFGAVLQQDRANYHRFGRRDPQDQGDGLFGDQAVRAQIPALFAAHADNAWWNRNFHPATSAPLDAEVLVVVCARGGRLSHLIVNHANGDGHFFCEGPEFAGN